MSSVQLAKDGKMVFSVSHGKDVVLFADMWHCNLLILVYIIDKTIKAHLLEDRQLIRSSPISNLVN